MSERSDPELRRHRNTSRNRRYRAKLQEQRLLLIEQLGGKCVDCGTTKKLEIDHIQPPADPSCMSRLSHAARILEYEIQVANGNAAPRCKRCNGKKSDRVYGY